MAKTDLQVPRADQPAQGACPSPIIHSWAPGRSWAAGPETVSVLPLTSATTFQLAMWLPMFLPRHSTRVGDAPSGDNAHCLVARVPKRLLLAGVSLSDRLVTGIPVAGKNLLPTLQGDRNGCRYV